MRSPAFVKSNIKKLTSKAKEQNTSNSGRFYIIDRGKRVEQKTCVVCQRPFTWRKKWERVWDEVTTCSKRCNSERRRQARIARKQLGKTDSTSSSLHFTDSVEIVNGSNTVDPMPADNSRAARKARKKELKAMRRRIREGKADSYVGQKQCTRCQKSSDLLVRCRIDSTRTWHMVCGKCWNIVSGGVADGDKAHPNYQYGGLWKNLKRL